MDALQQAISKAKHFGFKLKDAAMASDAFFPFPDCVDIAFQNGIISVIQPGGSIKDRPVLRMLTQAILDGDLTKDKVILDSSSGNAGIAYAMIGAVLGYEVELVIPENASQERKKRMQAHNANMVFCLLYTSDAADE